MELQFSKDIFGPVRALGLLPDEFHLQKAPDDSAWNVTISVSGGDRMQIIFAKLKTLPGLKSLSAGELRAANAPHLPLTEQNNV
jgi:hypothetical protein